MKATLFYECNILEWHIYCNMKWKKHKNAKRKLHSWNWLYKNSKGLTGVVAIRACVRPLALAKAPHGAFVVVDTFFIDGINVLLWRPQGPKGLLTVLTTVGPTRACRKERGRKTRCKKDERQWTNKREANMRKATGGKERWYRRIEMEGGKISYNFRQKMDKKVW